MDPKTPREQILEACAWAKAQGYTLAKGLWISFVDKKCCPLGAVLLQDTERCLHPVYYEIDVALKLDVSLQWIQEFNAGVDGGTYCEASGLLEAFKLGREIRGELVS